MRPDMELPALRRPADSLLSFVRCFGVEARSLVYVSAPITTGRRYLQWLSSQDVALKDPQSVAAHRQDVIAWNLSNASLTVRQVREKFTELVLDPTGLEDVAGWKQDDYHRFWVGIIDAYVKTIVFVDGWEYSTGCSIELITAYRNKIDVLDQRFQPLSSRAAAKLLGVAVAEFEAVSISATRLSQLAEDVQNFADEYSAV